MMLQEHQLFQGGRQGEKRPGGRHGRAEKGFAAGGEQRGGQGVGQGLGQGLGQTLGEQVLGASCREQFGRPEHIRTVSGGEGFGLEDDLFL